MVANTQFILSNVTIESFAQMIKERFSEAIDMEDDLKNQRHHSLTIPYTKEFHDELVKRLQYAPLEIVVENDCSIIKLIDGTDPKILCNAIDNWQNLNFNIEQYGTD